MFHIEIKSQVLYFYIETIYSTLKYRQCIITFTYYFYIIASLTLKYHIFATRVLAFSLYYIKRFQTIRLWVTPLSFAKTPVRRRSLSL